MVTPRDAMLLAAREFGSERALAKAIGFSQQAVYKARFLGRPTPEMATNIEIATKGLVTRTMLRPDVFGPREQLEMIKNSWKGAWEGRIDRPYGRRVDRPYGR